MLTILVFIIILGFLVFVHELGHFAVARRNGIKAEEFGFGFPPRALGVVKNDQTGKWDFVLGRKHIESKNTIYSINWLPIGGFVRIKGENGDEKGEDSFVSKSPWVRSKVLIAGVVMNFIFAWLLFSFGFMLGTPQEVENANVKGAYVLIEKVEDGSPAQKMGLKMGDVIEKKQTGPDGKTYNLVGVEGVQEFIGSNVGKEINLNIKRGKEELVLKGIPEIMPESGKGRIGVSLAQVAKVSYSLFPALWKGFVELGNVFLMIFMVLKMLLSGQGGGLDVTGVVGIAVYTGEVIPLGLAHILRFAAILSVNLGIINALPFPALDGGRILFIIIEKIKGSPVSQKLEQIFHTAGFAILIGLMIFVTYRDFLKFDVIGNLVGKIKGIF